jgi:AcrR family transcriptional regulator
MKKPGPEQERPALSRERVVQAAIALADAHGIGALSMRRLGRALGVEAMSLYHHVASKDDVLDGMVDAIMDEIGTPRGADWKQAMRSRANSAREVFRSHPWAIGVVDTRRPPGPGTLRHAEAVIGTLRGAGFSLSLALHAHILLDSYIYGFAVQETSLPVSTDEESDTFAEKMLEVMGQTYPHLAELTRVRVLDPEYGFGMEFEFGLDLILDRLAELHAAEVEAR